MRGLFTVIMAVTLWATVSLEAEAQEGGNDFSGTTFTGAYRIRTVFYNYGSATPLVTSPIIGPETDSRTRILVDQRFRFSLTSQANKNLKGVLAFEVGDMIWGVGTHGVGENYGGAQGADVVNIETRNAYLDFNIPDTRVNLKVGIQSPMDGFKGYLFDWDWDFDVAGVEITTGFNTHSFTVGAFRLNEGGDLTKADDRDLLKIGADLSFSGKCKVNPYIYFLNDNLKFDRTTRDLWAGISCVKEWAGFDLSGFILYNKGKTDFDSVGVKDIDNSGLGLNFEGSKNLGPTTLSLQVTHSTGEKERSTSTSRGDFHVILGPNYAGYLEIFTSLNEDVAGLNADLNNSGLGLLSLQVRARFEPREKIWTTLAGGILRSTAENAYGKRNKGFELDAVVGYKFTSGLTAELGTAYVLVGDFYKTATNPNPDDMFEIYTRLQYLF
ncbi:MAG: hypothetical protein JSV84_03010 [Gemmatimonadota bacterium]|nr:MAG: hypothetical protein JSV84_03010 [Gemmatimonadota bacterium]